MRGRGVGAMFWLTTVDAPRLSIYVKVIARDRSLKGVCTSSISSLRLKFEFTDDLRDICVHSITRRKEVNFIAGNQSIWSHSYFKEILHFMKWVPCKKSISGISIRLLYAIFIKYTLYSMLPIT